MVHHVTMVATVVTNLTFHINLDTQSEIKILGDCQNKTC